MSSGCLKDVKLAHVFQRYGFKISVGALRKLPFRLLQPNNYDFPSNKIGIEMKNVYTFEHKKTERGSIRNELLQAAKPVGCKKLAGLMSFNSSQTAKQILVGKANDSHV